MRLEKASYKAIKYACMNFHYAKSVPVNTIGFSVFNKKNEWCGVILYGSGANNNMPKPYGLVAGQVYEVAYVKPDNILGITDCVNMVLHVIRILAKKPIMINGIDITKIEAKKIIIGNYETYKFKYIVS